MEHKHMEHKDMSTEVHHDKHAGHNVSDFKNKFIISLFLTIPLLILSKTLQDIFGYSLKFQGDEYLQLILATILFFYCGLPFLKGALTEIKNNAIGMMTLISVAISVAYFYSFAVVFGFSGMDFFWELGTLVSIMLLGHWIEMKSVMGASKALEMLAQLLPKKATKIKNGEAILISLEDVRSEDILLIKANEKIPTDGVIISGETYIDESMLTGESKPVKKAIGDVVIGGGINGKGTVTIKVTGVGADSYLSAVIDIVKQAQNTKSKTQNLADKAAKWLTYIALFVGVATLIIWLLLGKDLSFAIMMMVGVMIIACPYALGLAIPLVVSNSISKVAQNGILVRNRTAFENSDKITAVVFDKTGTLTIGNFTIVNVEQHEVASLDGIGKEKIVQYIASVEQFSEHPIGQAIVKYAEEHHVKLLDVENYESITAKGVRGTVSGYDVKVLSPTAVEELGINLPTGNHSIDKTIIYLLINEQLVGYIELADQIREESKTAIQELRQHGIKVYMATGDNEAVAASVSQELDLDGYYAELLPEHKLEILDELISKGNFVAMVGDGVNDAPALARADIGIAIGSGTAVANEAADIILINNNPSDVYKMIKWGGLTKKKMVQNLLWATVYNVLAIPVAAGVLYPYFLLPPALGAAIMSLSTIIVAINAQLLLKQIK